MAARRSRKNGRFTKSTSRRRRSKPKTNLTNLAISALVANQITQGAFHSNIADFFTGRRDGVYAAGGDGSYRLTLPEIIGLSGSGGVGGTFTAGSGLTFGKVVSANLRADGMRMIASAVLSLIAAQAMTKVLKKPVINPLNKALKMTGLDVKV